MIQVFASNKEAIGQFDNYDALSKYINSIENSKLAECSSRSLGEIWSFALYTNKRLSYIYYKTLERSFSKVGKEAFEQELDLIEIYKGGFESPIQIPVTADINVQELKESWCQEYCEAHNYLLVDYKNNFEGHVLMDGAVVANVAREEAGQSASL